MTAAARVVVIQTLNRIEPELAADVGELPIDAPAEAPLERARHSSGKAVACEISPQYVVEIAAVDRRGRNRRGAHRAGGLQVGAAAQRECRDRNSEDAPHCRSPMHSLLG